MNSIVSNEEAIELLNTLEVMYSENGERPDVLIKDDEQFREVCNALSISETVINRFMTKNNMIEILALAANTYGLGYYDFEKGFLIDKSCTE
ncbi:hypothetical protein C4A75_00040 [Brevibacillus laterosporus]|uniref:hypothetical protein n=1 Tax=Brevibacillus laterosporus TaxID=1465 RepID=UPI000CE31B28|nr:hypothetical protein [Brevibacillus laterosporus]PPA87646.1 hypothetical protein C4A75_00040 [Brevibacillus laterosporus]